MFLSYSGAAQFHYYKDKPEQDNVSAQARKNKLEGNEEN
jgi:hypothetical protein